MLKKFYKIIIVPYTLFLLYLMFFGMGRSQYEDNQITVEPVLSTIKFIHNTIELRYIVTICFGECRNVHAFWIPGMGFARP